MTITDKQLAARDQGIGSSEVAAILGRDPYRTSWDVWAVKTGRAEPQAENSAMRIGTRLERALLDMAQDELGQKIVAPTSTFVRGILRANVDGMLERFQRGATIVEAKTTSASEGWGTPGTADVPERVFLQAQHQMLCADSPRVYVARLLASFGFQFALYQIDRDEDVCAEIDARCREWWNAHVIGETAPAATASMETLARIRREAKKVDIDSTLINRERIARTVLDRAEAEYDAAKIAVLTAMGDGDMATDGTWTVRYTQATRTSADMAEILKRWPEAKDLNKTSTFRRFDVRKIGATK